MKTDAQLITVAWVIVWSMLLSSALTTMIWEQLSGVHSLYFPLCYLAVALVLYGIRPGYKWLLKKQTSGERGER